MKVRVLTALVLSAVLFTTPLLGQTAAAENPLDRLVEVMKGVLDDAAVPLTSDQQTAIALMVEDRRQASEQLFGQTMDFRGGPVQQQQMDRALAGIRWMEEEIAKCIIDYLTPIQLAAWARHEALVKPGENQPPAQGSHAPTPIKPPPPQTQFVRVDNNAFTAERGSLGGTGSEVIERGGAGAFHGQGAFNFQDFRLNARNAFAGNRPPYQERQIDATFGGPVIRNRLTAAFSLRQNESQNAGTVHATLPDRLFELGIVRPNVTRAGGVRGTYQLTNSHSLMFNLGYETNVQKNNSVGGYTLPERASVTRGHDSTLSVRHFFVSDRLVYEQSLERLGNGRRNQPLSDGMAVDVLDAFRSGGGQDRSQTSSRDYTFGNLLTGKGASWTVKGGVDGAYYTSDDISSSNFTGTFTFSSLDDYMAGRPVTFRITRGDPQISVHQLELSPFIQGDIKAMSSVTLMLGARYAWQTNLRDSNNLAPRLSFAWVPGRGLAVRGGVGLFFQRLPQNIVQTQHRLDGTRQYEIVINSPSWPDPFQSGDVSIKLPTSVRVTAPDLVAPYASTVQLGVEKTFRNSLFLGLTFLRSRGTHLFRSRNLNAPLAGEAANPDPTRGQVVQLESTGASLNRDLRVTARQRFSIFNVEATLSCGQAFNDGDGWMALPSDSYHPDADWGRASGHAPRSFSVSGNARLPLGLFVRSTLQWSSGPAYNITTGTDDNHDGVTNDRPAGGRRNSATGRDFRSAGFNISKAVYFGGQGGRRTNLNWFINLSNAFNRVNLGTPSGVMTSPNFGKSTSARNPRELEVGTRFNF